MLLLNISLDYLMIVWASIVSGYVYHTYTVGKQVLVGRESSVQPDNNVVTRG